MKIKTLNFSGLLFFFNVSAYSNHTTNYLTKKVKNYEIANLGYKRKIFANCKSNRTRNKIETSDFMPSNFFVKILDDKKEIKVFKIIKTN